MVHHAGVAQTGAGVHGCWLTLALRGGERLRSSTIPNVAESRRSRLYQRNIVRTLPPTPPRDRTTTNSESPIMSLILDWAARKRPYFVHGVCAGGPQFARAIQRAEITGGDIRGPTSMKNHPRRAIHRPYNGMARGKLFKGDAAKRVPSARGRSTHWQHNFTQAPSFKGIAEVLRNVEGGRWPRRAPRSERTSLIAFAGFVIIFLHVSRSLSIGAGTLRSGSTLL